MSRFGWQGLVSLLTLTVLSSPGLEAQFQVEGRAASFTLGGRLHVQARHDSPDDAAVDQFFIRRARLQADVAIGDLLDARVQPDFSGGEMQLQDAWVRLNLHGAFRLSMGQFQRAHEGFERTSSTELPVIERDGRISGVAGCEGVGGICSYGRLVARLRYVGRDAGLRAEGRLAPGWSYVATATNGTGVNVSDENDAKSVSGRLTWAVSEGVVLSGFYGLHDYPDPAADDETEHGAAGGLDLVVGRFRDGLRLQGGFVVGDNWQSGPSTTFRAVQVLTSWYRPLASSRWAGVEPLLRVGWADPDSDAPDDAGLLVTPGLNVYVQGRNRIGVNVDVYDPATGDGAWSLKVQSSLYF